MDYLFLLLLLFTNRFFFYIFHNLRNVVLVFFFYFYYWFFFSAISIEAILSANGQKAERVGSRGFCCTTRPWQNRLNNRAGSSGHGARNNLKKKKKPLFDDLTIVLLTGQQFSTGVWAGRVLMEHYPQQPRKD